LSLKDFMTLSTCIVSLHVRRRESKELTSAVRWTSIALLLSSASASDILSGLFERGLLDLRSRVGLDDRVSQSRCSEAEIRLLPYR